MTQRFRLGLAQLNPVVGAIRKNSDRALDIAQSLGRDGADLVVFPELFVSGYPVQDLVIKQAFVRDCMRQVGYIAQSSSNLPMIGIGSPCVENDKVYNAYFILANGSIKTRIFKHHLPNMSVFDEVRQFEPGPLCGPFQAGPIRIGTPICEDAWYEDVCEMHMESGADLLIVPNGSPYFRGRQDQRIHVMVSRVVETGLPLVYLNMVGGQDDLLFDGSSFILNKGGELAVQLPAFDEATEIVEFTCNENRWTAKPGSMARIPDDLEQDYRAMVEGVRDYFSKSGFQKSVIGISGGIDSALVATISADALGAKNTRCIFLPSRYSSIVSREDAEKLALNLSCRFDIIPINSLHKLALDLLEPIFENRPIDLTEENIQSRIRGLLLMAISNKFGELLLTTGNKSEAAVGYATIYGDMAGGYNPIKDLYKTRVFATCKWRNSHHCSWMKGPSGSVVPDRIIEKPPTAELREGQRDTDSLPPYDQLDEILEHLIEDDCPVEEIVAKGHDKALVLHVEQLIFRSEYKRYQSAPGVRLTRRALWLDRRYPIVNQWHESISND